MKRIIQWTAFVLVSMLLIANHRAIGDAIKRFFQDGLGPILPGSLIKLPLGKHRATGKKCLFLDAEGKPYQNQHEFLQKFQKVDIDSLAKKLKVRRSPRAARKATKKGKTPSLLKPCVENLIRDGTEEGYRNKAAFLISCELRRISVPKAVAGGALSTWNLRNNPPLRRDELQQILCSAYSPEARYEFGCKWEGVLGEIMPAFCVGKGNCLYLAVLKEINTDNKN